MDGAKNADIAEGKELLAEVASMLSGLSRSVALNRVREGGGVYGGDPSET